MRIVFFLVLLAGLGAGLAYPWIATNFSGREIGAWRVYERDGEFRPITVKLSGADAPVRVLVDMTAVAPPEFAPKSTVLTVTASNPAGTVLAEALNFAESQPQERSPQLRQKAYRDEAGVIADIADGDYTFVVGRGDSDGIQIQSVDLILRGGAGFLDTRLQPVGFALIAVGFIGLVLAMRSGRRTKTFDAPQAPRWGRGGDTK